MTETPLVRLGTGIHRREIYPHQTDELDKLIWAEIGFLVVFTPIVIIIAILIVKFHGN